MTQTTAPAADYAEIATRPAAREHIAAMMAMLTETARRLSAEIDADALAHEMIRKDAYEAWKRSGFAWEVDPTDYSSRRHDGAALVLSELEVWPA